MKAIKMMLMVMFVGMLAICLFPTIGVAASFSVPALVQTATTQDTTTTVTSNTVGVTAVKTASDPAIVSAGTVAQVTSSGSTTSAPAWFNGSMTAYNVSWSTNVNGTNGLAFKLFYPNGTTFQFQKCVDLTTGTWTSVKSAELLSPLPSLSTEVGTRFGPFMYNTATWLVYAESLGNKGFFRAKSTNYPTNPVENVSRPQMARQ